MSIRQVNDCGMNEQTNTGKRTQAERRAETREALLSAANQLFGQQGYESTSLEEIAEQCGLTIRPIYYHFENKRGLFAATYTVLEQQAREALCAPSSVMAWEAFLALCEDQAFRQIMLVDAPNVLGRERWTNSQRFPWSGTLGVDDPRFAPACERQNEMCGRVARAALTEAALAVMETGNNADARSEAIALISRLLPEPYVPELASSV